MRKALLLAIVVMATVGCSAIFDGGTNAQQPAVAAAPQGDAQKDQQPAPADEAKAPPAQPPAANGDLAKAQKAAADEKARADKAEADLKTAKADLAKTQQSGASADDLKKAQDALKKAQSDKDTASKKATDLENALTKANADKAAAEAKAADLTTQLKQAQSGAPTDTSKLQTDLTTAQAELTKANAKAADLATQLKTAQNAQKTSETQVKAGSSGTTTGTQASGSTNTCPDPDRLIEGDPDWKGKAARNAPSDPSKVVKTSLGCIIQGDVLISGSPDGPWSRTFDDDPKTGSITVCRFDTGCYVYSQWGTNIGSEKSVCELVAEAKQRGCEGGCREVAIYNFNPKGGLGKEPDCSGAPTAPGLTPQAPKPTTTVVDCGFELQPTEVRLVKAGCYITGDVEAYIGPATTVTPAVPTSREDLLHNWKPLHDSDQYSGAVIKITRDTWVMPIYGAGLHSPDLNIDGLRASMILSGCHTGTGCRRIDQTASSYP